MPTPFPANEAARIQALHGLAILDTPPEERFDRLVRITQHLFGMPIVLISLIDTDRQWFKACIGVPVQETSRDLSFCARAILQPTATLIIDDTHRHPDFSTHPMVVGDPHIRFYAGHVLRDPTGHAMGTLCLLDTVPHAPLSPHDQRLFADMASLVERELAFRSSAQPHTDHPYLTAALHASETRFTTMAASIDEVFSISDPTTLHFHYLSPAYERLWQQSCLQCYADPLAFYATIHPDDQAQVIAARSTILSRPCTITYRLILPTHTEERWIREQLYPVAAADSPQIVGVARDISEERQQHSIVQQLTDQLISVMRHLPGVVYRCALDHAWTMQMITDGIETLTGYPAPTFIQNQHRTFASCIHPDDAAMVDTVIHAAVAQHQPYAVDYRLIHRDGSVRWVTDQGQAQYDENGQVCWLDGMILDVTDRKRMEAEHRRFKQVIDAIPDLVAMATLDGRPIYMNGAGRALVGLTDTVLDAHFMRDLHPPTVHSHLVNEAVPTALQTGLWRGETMLLDAHGHAVPVDQLLICHYDDRGQPVYFSTIARNLTHQKATEAHTHALQAAIITAQERFIAELSTPLITIAEGVILMPLIGSIDHDRVIQMQHTLSHGVRQHHARVVLVDFTGVSLLAPPIAPLLVQMAQMLRLLGSTLILTGMHPELAQTLIGWGSDLGQIHTYNAVHQGIAMAFRLAHHQR